MDQKFTIRSLAFHIFTGVVFFHGSDKMKTPKKIEQTKTHLAQKDTFWRICNIWCVLLLAAIIFVIFCVLKLTHVIAWGWGWVTAPLWMPIGLTVGLLVFILVTVMLIALIQFFQSIAQGYRK